MFWFAVVIAAAVGCAGPLGEAQSAPIYGGQSRLVDASAGPSGGFAVNDSESTYALGSWFETVGISYPGGGASASAYQDSVIDASGIVMLSKLSASANDGYNGIAQSILNVSFTLLAPTPYTSQALQTPYFFSFANNSQSFAANSSGTLPVGNYSLSVRYLNSAGPLAGSSGGDYEYALSFVPEPSSWLPGACGMLMLAAIRLSRRISAVS